MVSAASFGFCGPVLATRGYRSARPAIPCSPPQLLFLLDWIDPGGMVPARADPVAADPGGSRPRVARSDGQQHHSTGMRSAPPCAPAPSFPPLPPSSPILPPSPSRRHAPLWLMYHVWSHFGCPSPSLCVHLRPQRGLMHIAHLARMLERGVREKFQTLILDHNLFCDEGVLALAVRALALAYIRTRPVHVPHRACLVHCLLVHGSSHLTLALLREAEGPELDEGHTKSSDGKSSDGVFASVAPPSGASQLHCRLSFFSLALSLARRLRRVSARTPP